jgi:hypothetical protein
VTVAQAATLRIYYPKTPAFTADVDNVYSANFPYKEQAVQCAVKTDTALCLINTSQLPPSLGSLAIGSLKNKEERLQHHA